MTTPDPTRGDPVTEHHFTDETATVVVLNSLIRDMHHALSRIASACTIVWMFFLLSAAFRASSGQWIGVGIALAGAAGFFLLGHETNKRRRKYQPGTKGGKR